MVGVAYPSTVHDQGMEQAWTWALSAVGLLGLWLAGRKSPWGWAVGVGAQVLWLVYGVTTGRPAFVVSAIAYATVYSRNFVRWRCSSRRVTRRLERV